MTIEREEGKTMVSTEEQEYIYSVYLFLGMLTNWDVVEG